MNETKLNVCACKGIRKCVICSPNSVIQELNQEQKSFNDSKNLFLYCLKCNKSTRVSSTNLLIDFIDQNIQEIPCLCADTNDSLNINGIFIKNNYLNLDEESFLVSQINKSKWVESQSGRFKQDYGPKANFNKKKLKHSTFTGLPGYSKFLIDRLNDLPSEQVKNFVPVELCNLRYDSKRTACIDPHFDDFWLWGERLITFNLLENTFLTLTPGKDIEGIPVDCQVLLPLCRFSVIILSNDARYKWMHAIKKSHIKSTRLAITIRELTDEFKSKDKNGNIGAVIEELALSYKGISVGTVEDVLKENSITIFHKAQNESDVTCHENFHTLKRELSNLEYFIFDSDLESDLIFTEEICTEIGIVLAKWAVDSKKFLENHELTKKQPCSNQIENFFLLSNDFEVYLDIVKYFLNKAKLELGLKSKLLSTVYRTKDLLENFSDQSELFYTIFDPNNIIINESNKIKFKIQSSNLHMSLKFNNLAFFISKFIYHNDFNLERIRPKIRSILSGYSSLIPLNPKDLELLNNLIFFNLVTGLNDSKNSNLIENFYLTNFE